MTVPFLDLTREWRYFEPELVRAFTEFGASNEYVLGEYTKSFEKNFALAQGYTYAIGVSSGLAALEVALLAEGVKRGDEVITVANSAVATALAISNIGAIPVFCDVKENFLIDETRITSLITERTRAIVPVHLYGEVCNMEAINTIASRFRLVVVEDACQAHGAAFGEEGELKNTKAFSFYPTKNLGALGEAGMVVTNSRKVYDFIEQYRNYGQTERYVHTIRGNNYRIDALQCAFLNVKLRKLKDFVSVRNQIACGYVDKLSDIQALELPRISQKSAAHLFVVRITNGLRESFRKHLSDQGVGTVVHYPTPIHRQPCYEEEYRGICLSQTEEFSNDIVSLPCYPFFRNDEQEYVIKIVRDFFKHSIS